MDPRQVRGSFLQRIRDFVAVPLRVAVRTRIPNRLLAVHGLAVDDRGDFAVARAQVEADPAAIPMPAERRGAFAGGRDIARVGERDFKRSLVDPPPHEVCVEPTSGRFGEMSLKAPADVGRAAEPNLPSAARPE